MIQIDLIDYSQISSLGIKVTRYVNENLQEIIRVLMDIMSDDPDFEIDFLFPRDYFMRKPDECRNTIYELYELISSDVIRDYIKPKYNNLLYGILTWWEECADSENSLLINSVDSMLQKELVDAEQEGLLNRIQDYQEYYYMCFPDHDFLPSSLGDLVVLYLRNPSYGKFFGYENLDEYVDLMDCDLREQYLEVRRRQRHKENRGCDVPENIVTEILALLRRFQKRIVQFEKRGETEITADIHDALAGVLNSKYGINVSREFTMGRAKKKLGETDLYFSKEIDGIVEDYAVLENKYIENFTDQYFQLMGYMNQNFKFGITLSINRKLTLKAGLDRIEEKLKAIDKEQAFSPLSVNRVEFGADAVIVSQHIVPETEKTMKVYHLIFHLNDTERKEAADVAR